MRKNILVLVGNPRKGGNTDILVNAFIEGTLEAGHRVGKIIYQYQKQRNQGGQKRNIP